MDKLLSHSAKTEISKKVMDILRAHHISNIFASKFLAYHWIRTPNNLSNMLSKHWDHPSVYNMIMKLLITSGPITLIPREATQDTPS